MTQPEGDEDLGLDLFDQFDLDRLDSQPGQTQFDSQTGAHFHYLDLTRRIKQMIKRRNIIDDAIDEENRL
jgi:hypothetical protein